MCVIYERMPFITIFITISKPFDFGFEKSLDNTAIENAKSFARHDIGEKNINLGKRIQYLQPKSKYLIDGKKSSKT